MSGSDTIWTSAGLSQMSAGDILQTLVGSGITRQRLDTIDSASDQKKVQLAKDFESVLITKLFDQVQTTIGSLGPEQDAATRQVHGIFWLHLAQDVANNGGFGLWKEIYQSLYGRESNAAAGQLVDGNL